MPNDEGVFAVANGTVALEWDPLLLTLVTLAAFLLVLLLLLLWLCPGESMIKSLLFKEEDGEDGDPVELLKLLVRWFPPGGYNWTNSTGSDLLCFEEEELLLEPPLGLKEAGVLIEKVYSNGWLLGGGVGVDL